MKSRMRIMRRIVIRIRMINTIIIMMRNMMRIRIKKIM